jgi:hypothetical protein
MRTSSRIATAPDREQPTLVLPEIGLPDIDGIQVASRGAPPRHYIQTR